VERLWILVGALVGWLEAVCQQHRELRDVLMSLGHGLAERGVLTPESVALALRRARAETWLRTNDPDDLAGVFARVCREATTAELKVLGALSVEDAPRGLLVLDAEIRRRAVVETPSA
jgi:hypothetical protein